MFSQVDEEDYQEWLDKIIEIIQKQPCKYTNSPKYAFPTKPVTIIIITLYLFVCYLHDKILQPLKVNTMIIVQNTEIQEAVRLRNIAAVLPCIYICFIFSNFLANRQGYM